MKKFQLDEISKLFELGQKLTTNPEEDTKDATLSLLSQMAQTEQDSQVTRSIVQKRTRARNKNLSDKIVVGNTPISINTDDGVGHEVMIILELESSPTGWNLIGVVHTDPKSEWAHYTVLVSQDGIIEDFSEIAQGKDFSLEIKESERIMLKFISTDHEIILLENVLLDFE